MRNDGLCASQQNNQMKERIFDAVDEWPNYNDADSNICISINHWAHKLEVREKADT